MDLDEDQNDIFSKNILSKVQRNEWETRANPLARPRGKPCSSKHLSLNHPKVIIFIIIVIIITGVINPLPHHHIILSLLNHHHCHLKDHHQQHPLHRTYCLSSKIRSFLFVNNSGLEDAGLYKCRVGWEILTSGSKCPQGCFAQPSSIKYCRNANFLGGWSEVKLVTFKTSWFWSNI